MGKWWLFLPALLGLLAWPAAPATAQEKARTEPTLVVRVRSIDGLLADVKYLSELVGRPDDAKKIEAGLKQALPTGFQGIDPKRPLGVYATLDPDGNLQETTAVVLIPISDEKAFTGLVEKLSGQSVKSEDDGIQSLSLPNLPFPVYFRFANKYAYATIREKDALAPARMLAPEKLLPPDHLPALSASFRIDHIPDALKQIVLGQAELRLADVEEEKPAGETPAQHALKVQTAKAASQRIATVIKEGSELGIKLDVDRQAKVLSAELSLSGKPGSSLATEMATVGKGQSLFAGLAQPDSAVTFGLHALLPEHLRKNLGPVIDEGFTNALAKEKDAAKRALAKKLLDAIAPTLKSGDIDVAANLRGPAADQHYTLVAAIKVKDGANIETAFKDVLKDLPEADKQKIKLDAETIDGVKVHRLDIQKDLDDEGRKLFGENPLYLAMRPNAVFLTGGVDALGALRTALATSPKSAPPMEVVAHFARLVPAMTKTKGDPKAAAKQAFTGGGTDQLHVSVNGGDAIRLRLELQAAVIRFFALVEKKDSAEK